VFHGVSAQPSSPTWSSWFNSNNFNSNKCSYEAVLTEQGTFAAGGVVAATTGDFDLNGAWKREACRVALVLTCSLQPFARSSRALARWCRIAASARPPAC
jgi:hypothetical protein